MNTAAPLKARGKVSRTGHPSQDSRITVEVISNARDLASVESFWRASTVKEDNPFAMFDWNRAWVRHLAAKHCDQICFVVVRRGGKLRSLFPLIRKGGKLEFAASEICDFHDIIAEDDDAVPEGVDALLDWLHREKLDLSPIVLSNRGRLEQELMRRSWRGSRFLVDRKLFGPGPWLEIQGTTLQEITGQFSKNTRKKIRRWHRILQEGPGVTQRVADQVDREFLERAGRMHQQLQREKEGGSVFDDPALTQFLLEVALSDEVGMMGTMMESSDGDWMTFDIGFVRQDRFHSWLCAYNTDYADYRPGQVSMGLLLEQLAQRGIRIFDLLCGGDLYKFHYADKEYRVHLVRVLRKTPRNRVSVGIRKIDNRLRPVAKRVLHRLGLFRTQYRID